MSNKTPAKHDVVTESARKLNHIYRLVYFVRALLITCLVVLIVCTVFLFFNRKQSTLSAPNGTISLEVAKTSESRKQGLSGRESIGDNSGMLFVFDSYSYGNCFWMKDMEFSIDMVWIDENKKVITVEEDVSPDSYPESFCPTEPAKYGLELGAGNATKFGIDTGTTLEFNY